MLPFARTALFVLALGPALPALGGVLPTDSAPAARTTTIAIPQRFLEADHGFHMLGGGLALSLETGLMRWVISAPDDGSTPPSVVSVVPVHGRLDAAPVGERVLPGIVSRFSGSPDQWRAGRRTYDAVRYPQLWPGIDLLLEAAGQQVKGTYQVAPGANPGAIRLRHTGAESLRIDAEGRLVVHTPAGDLIDAAPVAWQHIDGQRCDVPVAFALCDAGDGDGSVDVSFDIGPHDPTVELLIDPAVIVQAGFLGGAERDQVAGMVVDSAGNVFLTGFTRSTEATFPVLVGPDLTWAGPPLGSHGDVFVAKIDPTGNTLLYAGFIGGTQLDYASDIEVDSLGRAYISGRTSSTQTQGFPVTVGPDLTHNGDQDAFVARVSADGTSLDYCGYIGGNSEDRGLGIGVDAQFRAYVVGRFESLVHTLPLLVGPSLTPPGGPAYDGFVARVSPNGTGLEYCGYIGGTNQEDLTDVAPDALGGAWVTGWTLSTDLPVSVGPDLTHNGGVDVVLAHVSPDGTHLDSCGYLGSSLSDFPVNLVVAASGSVYVGGLSKDAFSFPAVVGPSLTPVGVIDGFITKVAANGTAIVWSGFTNTETFASIEVDAEEGVWFVSGLYDGPFGEGDSLLGRVLPSGAAFDFTHPFGGTGNDGFGFIALAPNSPTPGVTEVWAAGTTSQTEADFPFMTGPDVTANGDLDAILVRLQIADDPWTDLGFAKAGTHGLPVLSGTGTLGPLAPWTVTLSNALENTTAWVAAGYATVFAPFKGGVFVPDIAAPGFVLPLPTGPAGQIVVGEAWPAGVPAGFSIYLQYWIQDPAAATAPFSASNGLRGTTP